MTSLPATEERAKGRGGGGGGGGATHPEVGVLSTRGVRGADKEILLRQHVHQLRGGRGEWQIRGEESGRSEERGGADQRRGEWQIRGEGSGTEEIMSSQ